ncbi:MAG TPA: LysR family transcriptional regulator [Myxococcaceae bacterium]|nr:LysR family transcriptional regulator [Myxococcaceae bacterium]
MSSDQKTQALNLQRLWVLRRVAQEGSFTRAAATLYLSQPAVSAHIQALERELGCVLFERGGRGVGLTPEGKHFLDYVNRGLGTIEEGIATLRESKSHQTLTVGAVVSVSLTILPAILERFRAEAPNVRVTMRMGHSPEIVRMVTERAVDVGFVVIRPTTNTVACRLILEDPVVLVASASHPLARQRIHVDALRRELVLLTRWGEDFDVLQQTLRSELGEEFYPAVEVDPAEAAKRMVLQGVGLTFLGESMVRDELASGVLATIDITGLPPLSRRVYLVHHRRGSRMPVVRRFLDAVHFIHKPTDQVVVQAGRPSARVITDISSESDVGPDQQLNASS